MLEATTDHKEIDFKRDLVDNMSYGAAVGASAANSNLIKLNTLFINPVKNVNCEWI